MTEDFAKRRKEKPPAARKTRARAATQEPSGKRTGPFLAGLTLGLGLTLLAWLANWIPAREQADVATPRLPEAVLPPGIRFEFPDLLRDAEVLVPYVEEYLQQETNADSDIDYLLQAGAFRTGRDADRRRAAILLLDLEARTLRVTRQGETWHRVLVGPFPNRSSVRNAQVRLLGEDIDSIVLKTQREGAGPGA